MSNLFDILSFKPKVEGNREAASAQTNPECEPKQSRKWSESHGPPPPSHQQVGPAVGGPSRTDAGGSPVEPPSTPPVIRKLSPRSPRKEPLLDLETLKAFTIPKKKKLKKELLEVVSLDSREFQHEILPLITQSFKERGSDRCFKFARAQLVYNKTILHAYLERRKDMRQNGYSEKEVADSPAFMFVESKMEMRKVCEEGIQVSNSKITCLGHPDMGVYLSRHADIIRPHLMDHGSQGYMVVFKVIKGKVKSIVENRTGVPFDPTPNFDCHVSKMANVDLSSTSPQYAFESSQIYLYEYGDLDIEARPSHICPYAVVQFTYKSDGRNRPVLTKQSSRRTSGSSSRSGPPALEPPVLTHHRAPPLLPTPKMPPLTSQESTPVPGGLLEQLEESLQETERAEKENVALAALIGQHVEGGGCIVWAGHVTNKGQSVCPVEMVVYGTFLKPAKIGQELGICARVKLSEIRPLYLADAVVKREGETQAGERYYQYCELRPTKDSQGKFNQLMTYLSKSETAAVVNLDESTELLILTNCELTQELQLSQAHTHPMILHCFTVSYTSRRSQAPFAAKNQSPVEQSVRMQPLTGTPLNAPWNNMAGNEPTDKEPTDKVEQLDNGFQKFVPVNSLVYRYQVKLAFHQQMDIQDKRNIEIARNGGMAPKNSLLAMEPIIKPHSVVMDQLQSAMGQHAPSASHPFSMPNSAPIRSMPASLLNPIQQLQDVFSRTMKPQPEPLQPRTQFDQQPNKYLYSSDPRLARRMQAQPTPMQDWSMQHDIVDNTTPTQNLDPRRTSLESSVDNLTYTDPNFMQGPNLLRSLSVGTPHLSMTASDGSQKSAVPALGMTSSAFPRMETTTLFNRTETKQPRSTEGLHFSDDVSHTQARGHSPVDSPSFSPVESDGEDKTPVGSESEHDSEHDPMSDTEIDRIVKGPFLGHKPEVKKTAKPESKKKDTVLGKTEKTTLVAKSESIATIAKENPAKVATNTSSVAVKTVQSPPGSFDAKNMCTISDQAHQAAFVTDVANTTPTISAGTTKETCINTAPEYKEAPAYQTNIESVVQPLPVPILNKQPLSGIGLLSQGDEKIPGFDYVEEQASDTIKPKVRSPVAKPQSRQSESVPPLAKQDTSKSVAKQDTSKSVSSPTKVKDSSVKPVDSPKVQKPTTESAQVHKDTTESTQVQTHTTESAIVQKPTTEIPQTSVADIPLPSETKTTKASSEKPKKVEALNLKPIEPVAPAPVAQSPASPTEEKSDPKGNKRIVAVVQKAINNTSRAVSAADKQVKVISKKQPTETSASKETKSVKKLKFTPGQYATEEDLLESSVSKALHGWQDDEKVSDVEEEVLWEEFWLYALHFLPWIHPEDEREFQLVDDLAGKENSQPAPEVTKDKIPTDIPTSAPSISQDDGKRKATSSMAGRHKFHPYKTIERKEKPKAPKKGDSPVKIYAAARDLRELMDCLTSKNFQDRRKNRGVRPDFWQSRSNTESARFRNFQFQRATLADVREEARQARLDEEDMEYVVTDIPDFEERKKKKVPTATLR